MANVETQEHMRYHAAHAHLGTPFGGGWFGAVAERIARFFGTPQYLIGQSLVVALWVASNVVALFHFDPYPFILLNLAFSLQAAYAAPLILLAQTRQAERDKMWSDADARHREELAQNTITLLEQNTDLTEQVAELSRQVRQLTAEIHGAVVMPRPEAGGAERGGSI
ncbi:MAG: DUF1003 domain-containing protein [Dehalococcoidia bacterium]|nr:DUF1003 domain-containing protein [Dehalococcoidia bacterium]